MALEGKSLASKQDSDIIYNDETFGGANRFGFNKQVGPAETFGPVAFSLVNNGLPNGSNQMPDQNMQVEGAYSGYSFNTKTVKLKSFMSKREAISPTTIPETIEPALEVVEIFPSAKLEDSTEEQK